MSTADHSPALPERKPDEDAAAEAEARAVWGAGSPESDGDTIRLILAHAIERVEPSPELEARCLAIAALVESQRETITTLTRERDKAWLGFGNLTDRAQDWGDALREALGERYPTMEQTVGAAIAAIHQRNGARAALSRAEADRERLTVLLWAAEARAADTD